jgi:hypothetical protein
LGSLRLPSFRNAFFEKKEKEPKKKAKRTEKERNYGTTSARPRQECLTGISVEHESFETNENRHCSVSDQRVSF